MTSRAAARSGEPWTSSTPTVLVVNEAHHLRSYVLEDLRLLANYRMDSDNRLCLLLVGQAEVRRQLDMSAHAAAAHQVSTESLLYCRLQPGDRLVPLRRSSREVVSGLGNRIRPDRESTFPPHALASDDARFFQYVQMLGHPLPREIETVRELRNGKLRAATEARNELKTRRVAKGREHWSCCSYLSGRIRIRHRRRCSWPECPSLPCSNAALPGALPLETAESPFP